MAVAVHLHPRAIGQEKLGLGTRGHLRTMLATITPESRQRCGRPIRRSNRPARCHLRQRWPLRSRRGSGFRHKQTSASPRRGSSRSRSTYPHFPQLLLPLSIQLLDRRALDGWFTRRARLTLIGNRAVDGAFVEVRRRGVRHRGQKGGEQDSLGTGLEHGGYRSHFQRGKYPNSRQYQAHASGRRGLSLEVPATCAAAPEAR